MKKTFVLALLFIFLISCSSKEKKIILRMNHQFPSTAAGSKIDQWFSDEIKKRSKGQVEIKIYWSNALGTARENLTLLRRQALDMAAMSAAYFPAELPFFSAPNSLPMTLKNIEQSSILMKEFISKVPAFHEEAKRNNIRPLFFHILNPYILFSKTPIKKLTDLKGKKIRTWGEDLPKLFQAVEAAPINVFLPEIYENLQRNLIHAVPFSVDLAVTYKLYEVVKYASKVVIWQGPAWGIWINEDKWQSIPEKYQQIIKTVAEEARKRELKTTREAAINAKAVLKEKGVKFIAFPATELASWKKKAPDFFELWIKKMEKRGQKEGAVQAVSVWKKVQSQY